MFSKNRTKEAFIKEFSRLTNNEFNFFYDLLNEGSGDYLYKEALQEFSNKNRVYPGYYDSLTKESGRSKEWMDGLPWTWVGTDGKLACSNRGFPIIMAMARERDWLRNQIKEASITSEILRNEKESLANTTSELQTHIDIEINKQKKYVQLGFILGIVYQRKRTTKELEKAKALALERSALEEEKKQLQVLKETVSQQTKELADLKVRYEHELLFLQSTKSPPRNL